MGEIFKKYLEAKLGYEIEDYVVENETERNFKFGKKEKRKSTGIRSIKIIPKRRIETINLDITINKKEEPE